MPFFRRVLACVCSPNFTRSEQRRTQPIAFPVAQEVHLLFDHSHRHVIAAPQWNLAGVLAQKPQMPDRNEQADGGEVQWFYRPSRTISRDESMPHSLTPAAGRH